MERLSQYLEDNNMSQADLAQRMGVSQPTVWGWLEGKIKPTADRLIKLSEVTGISIDELLTKKIAARKTKPLPTQTA